MGLVEELGTEVGDGNLGLEMEEAIWCDVVAKRGFLMVRRRPKG